MTHSYHLGTKDVRPCIVSIGIQAGEQNTINTHFLLKTDIITLLQEDELFREGSPKVANFNDE